MEETFIINFVTLDGFIGHAEIIANSIKSAIDIFREYDTDSRIVNVCTNFVFEIVKQF